MKKFEKFRITRRDYCQKLFTSRTLFITGLLMMPALLFNPVPLFRIYQFLLFWLFAWLSGKKNNPLMTLLVMLFIIAFNLLVPYGRVLYSFGVFKISSGALSAGIQRAVTLEGLIMLSKACIRQDLRLPGAFGELIGESFRFFGLITERKGIINRKNIIGSIDGLMLELSTEAAGPFAADAVEIAVPAELTVPAEAAVLAQGRTGAKGFVLLAAGLILAWLPWLMVILLKTGQR